MPDRPPFTNLDDFIETLNATVVDRPRPLAPYQPASYDAEVILRRYIRDIRSTCPLLDNSGDEYAFHRWLATYFTAEVGKEFLHHPEGRIRGRIVKASWWNDRIRHLEVVLTELEHRLPGCTKPIL